MIEWGTGNNAVNQASSDYYWSWGSYNQIIQVNPFSSQLLLPAVNFPRMVSLGIKNKSSTNPESTSIYFYLNQTNLDITNNLNENNSINIIYDFEAKKGFNLLNWEYNGSLHATTDPTVPAITTIGAIITVRTATKVYL